MVSGGIEVHTFKFAYYLKPNLEAILNWKLARVTYFCISAYIYKRHWAIRLLSCDINVRYGSNLESGSVKMLLNG